MFEHPVSTLFAKHPVCGVFGFSILAIHLNRVETGCLAKQGVRTGCLAKQGVPTGCLLNTIETGYGVFEPGEQGVCGVIGTTPKQGVPDCPKMVSERSMEPLVCTRFRAWDRKKSNSLLSRNNKGQME